MPNATNDTELVLRLQKDDLTAFNTLYWKYHQPIYLNIFKLIKESEATKDLLQEVFMTLWEKRLTLDVSQSVSGWLFVVSYTKTISLLKKLLKQPGRYELQEREQYADQPVGDYRETSCG